MKYQQPALPYAYGALEPYLSPETIEYHYGAHHKGYYYKLNELVSGTPYDGLSLEEIVATAPTGDLYNNAAQAWNHDFYWQCLSPNGGGAPDHALGRSIERCFGSVEDFKQAFEKIALELFGSGWVWLVRNPNGSLAITVSGGAGNPMVDGLTPILVCDLWEHAYYIDYRNHRSRYLHAFWDLVNWDFAAANFARDHQPQPAKTDHDRRVPNVVGWRLVMANLEAG